MIKAMKQRPFKQLKDLFNKACKHPGKAVKTLCQVFVDTVKDFRKPHEILMGIASIVLPGGFVAYGIYRLAVWSKKQSAKKLALPAPANDNAATAAPGQAAEKTSETVAENTADKNQPSAIRVTQKKTFKSPFHWF